MLLTYEVSYAEYKAAIRLYVQHKPWLRLRSLIYYLVIPLLTVLSIVVTAVASLTGAQDAAEAMVIPVTCLIALTLLVFVLRSVRLQRGFRNQFPAASKSRVISTLITEEGIVTSLAGIAESRLSWDAIDSFAVDRNVVLFYITEDRYFIVPLRAISHEDRRQLRVLLDSRAGREKR